MKLVTLGLLSCLCLCAQQASLEGLTLDAVTQKPLPRVHVSLISTGAGTNLAEPDDAYGAISDAAGHYSIADIRPGTYVVQPKHGGFVFVGDKDSGATPAITLKAGEQNKGFRISMIPEATITGRVVDEFGDPVQGASVRVVAVVDSQPYGLWTMHGDTDDRGEYRISGLPGRYFVEASIHPLQTNTAPELRSDGSLATAYATTYYPGALAQERAKPVEVTAAQTLAGIDIHVAHRRSLKISGIVTGAPAATRATVTIHVYHDGSQAEDSTEAGADGSFAFGGLAPAEYYLHATWQAGVSGADPLESPRVKVTVENADATVTLPVTAGSEMAGTLRFAGQSAGSVSDPKWTVRLTPIGLEGTPTKGGEVGPDGLFTIKRIIPGSFRLTVDPLPDNVYVGSALLGDAEVADADLDLSQGLQGTALKVTLSRDGGQVTGAVVDKNGHPMFGHPAFVILARDVNSIATWRSLVSAPVDSSFAIHGIRPGKYRIFALDPSQFGGMRSYEPLKGLAARAPEIEIKPDDRLEKDLRAMGKADAIAN